LGIAVVLVLTEKRGRYFPGRTFWSYALLYCMARFLIEFYRHDGPSELTVLSRGQIVSITVAVLSVVMLRRLAHRTVMAAAPIEAPPLFGGERSPRVG
jgi:prolipoprotein diacylglyceryltransferase